ncbi:hypothetical protein I3W98_09045, partial [Streptomyces cavourensis]|nr:hypothetical protein [Streptomyces cavourensis]
MRFLPVGDSMTIGATGDFTWRYRLWQHLDAVCPGSYEIVGPRTTLYDPGADAPLSHAYADPSFRWTRRAAGSPSSPRWRSR